MNVQAALRGPQRVAFTKDDFLRLRGTGAFAGFAKAELIEGKMLGVPLGEDGEAESDASVPIKLRVADYLLLDRAGAFEAYGKTELIEGDVYAMNAQHRPHARIKSRLHVLLAAALAGSGLEAIVEGSVDIPPNGAPEPDIVVTDAPEGEGLIPVGSVHLIVEISDVTIAFDLGVKTGVYATAGVPEYWVVDVNARMIHQSWTPVDGTYVERRTVAFAESITASTVERLTVETVGL